MLIFPGAFSLSGKRVLLTGPAGLYGRQLAYGLGRAGAKLILASRSLAPLQALACELAEEGIESLSLSYDQAQEASILGLRKQILESVGPVDVLVNNAVARPLAHGMQSSALDFETSMNINTTGLFLITRAFADSMVETNRSGCIVNIGSIQGLVGPDPRLYEGTGMSGWHPDYFFHKGGMVNFTRFVASYYGSHDIRCNCVAPGGLETPDMPPQFVSAYSGRTMLGRMAGEDDLAGVVIFLASEAARYITGVTLPVDGGYTAR